MYNRYIPQSDGSYRCSRVPEPKPRRQQPQAPSQPCTPSRQNDPRRDDIPPGDFFRQMLPGSFDTGDLLVVLLLLLMAGNSPRSRQNALLTLAFYFSM